MTQRTRLGRLGVAAVGLVLLCGAQAAWGAGPSLGTARGVRSAELSFDGKRWLALGGRSLPVLEGTQIRSGNGGVLVDLVDGSRVNVLPFTTVRVDRAGGATSVALDSGRLTFRLPVTTSVVIETPTARLDPVRTEPMAGEVFSGETTGLKMRRGHLEVRDASGSGTVMVAALEPVFVPKPPAITGPLFNSDVKAEAAPTGSRSIFSAKGESLGYIRPDGRFVIYPGFTQDLTSPFPQRTVQTAVATIPERVRSDAEPLFDVNGTFAGYVSGPMFYPQAESVNAVGAPGQSGIATAGVALGPALSAGGSLAGTAAIGAGASRHKRKHKDKCDEATPGKPGKKGKKCDDDNNNDNDNNQDD